MVKRHRGDGSLTGGLGDVNGAFLSTTVTQTGSDATTTQSIQTPVTVVAGRSSSDIMEILKVFFYFDVTPPPTANSNASRFDIYLSTKNFATTEPSLRQGDALVFAAATIQNSVTQSSAVGEITATGVYPIAMDLTDGAGHGFLVATSNIYAQLVSASTSQTNVCRIKILYRLKKVSESQLTSLLLSQNQG